ncbi:hypothetical protein PtA15_17A398 [Puccinia triticina]|uniref:Uncharacterized protein n=1 Tax=Puccinia triticina TaxID=208348 RepID=A0ABY7D5J1_9BASI|nr:uncharacterized protein PtA15_17A398 [Puccinia triticina]WAQ92916.1 hypothetical protein PtA15_17A398 [Puccinia triticina]WAR63809.1 hypothetical protein PtB15_17B410 [Puccinia triticina]
MPVLKSKLLTFSFNTNPLKLPNDSRFADPIISATKGAQTEVAELNGKKALRGLLVRPIGKAGRAYLYVEGLAEEGEVSYAMWLPSVAIGNTSIAGDSSGWSIGQEAV